VVNQNAIAKALRNIAEGEQSALVAQIISSHSLGEVWQVADQAAQFNRALSDDIANLRAVRTTLATNRDQVTAAKANLVSLQNDLTYQKRSVDANKAAQQDL